MKLKIVISIHFHSSYRTQSNNNGCSDNVNVNDRLLPLHQLCRNTFQSAVSLPSNPSNTNDLSDEEDFNPCSTQNTILSIFDCPNTARINGNAGLSMYQATRKLQVEETILDNEDMKRRMSVIPTNLEYTFMEMRTKIKSLKKRHRNAKEEDTNQNFREQKELEQFGNSSSEENTTEEENHSELIKAMPDFAR